MATRKALVLVSGLFQELNSSSDKLDFAGNSTTDLSEGSNQYFTNTRARGSISVAGSSGLTYNSSTGVLGTNAIPNAQLANSSVTIGSTSVSLGSTVTNFAGLGQLVMSNLYVGAIDAANTINIQSGQIIFEGSTADGNETIVSAADATGGDKSIIFPNNSGTVALTSDIVYPVTLDNSVTLTNKTLALGSNTISGTLAQFNTAVTDATLVSTTGSETLTNKSVNLANNTLTGTFAQFNTAVSNATLVSTTGTETLTNKSLTAPILTGSSSSAGSIIFKEDTDNGTNSATLVGPASTADVTITLPAETGTVLTTASSIANSNLANSTVTIGSSAVALGSSVTTLTGITSLTADAVVAKANGFRVIDNTDTTKQVAFDTSGVSTSTTRTIAVPNKNGTILTEVADDTSPQLGGQLDTNGNDIVISDGEKLSLHTYADVRTKTGATNAVVSGLTGHVIQNSLVLDSDQDIWLQSQGKKITFGTSDSATHEVARIQCAAVGASQHGFVYLNYVVANAGGNASSSTKLATTQTGVSITGNIAVTGTVDGVDVAARDTLFGGLTASSGVLSSGVTATTQSASDNSTKVATTAYVDNQVTAGAVNEFADNVFRVKDNSDASKKLAFECSGISGSTTRTMTVPNSDGTISTESFATAIAVALG